MEYVVDGHVGSTAFGQSRDGDTLVGWQAGSPKSEDSNASEFLGTDTAFQLPGAVLFPSGVESCHAVAAVGPRGRCSTWGGCTIRWVGRGNQKGIESFQFHFLDTQGTPRIVDSLTEVYIMAHHYLDARLIYLTNVLELFDMDFEFAFCCSPPSRTSENLSWSTLVNFSLLQL